MMERCTNPKCGKKADGRITPDEPLCAPCMMMVVSGMMVVAQQRWTPEQARRIAFQILMTFGKTETVAITMSNTRVVEGSER